MYLQQRLLVTKITRRQLGSFLREAIMRMNHLQSRYCNMNIMEGNMNNHWLKKIDSVQPKNKIEETWVKNGGFCGLWDWQQNAFGIYMDEQKEKKNEKK